MPKLKIVPKILIISAVAGGAMFGINAFLNSRPKAIVEPTVEVAPKVVTESAREPGAHEVQASPDVPVAVTQVASSPAQQEQYAPQNVTSGDAGLDAVLNMGKK
jgi:hypothetical protein